MMSEDSRESGRGDHWCWTQPISTPSQNERFDRGNAAGEGFLESTELAAHPLLLAFARNLYVHLGRCRLRKSLNAVYGTGSVRAGSLFRIFPTLALTGHAAISSAG